MIICTVPKIVNLRLVYVFPGLLREVLGSAKSFDNVVPDRLMLVANCCLAGSRAVRRGLLESSRSLPSLLAVEELHACCRAWRGHHMRHRDVLHLRDVVPQLVSSTTSLDSELLFDDRRLWRRCRCLSTELSEALLAADPRTTRFWNAYNYNIRKYIYNCIRSYKCDITV